MRELSGSRDYRERVAVLTVDAQREHSTKVLVRDFHGDSMLQPVCSCGYRGPRYPTNDRGTVEQALTTHIEQSPMKFVRWRWQLSKPARLWQFLGEPDALTSASQPTRLDAKQQ